MKLLKEITKLKIKQKLDDHQIEIIKLRLSKLEWIHEVGFHQATNTLVIKHTADEEGITSTIYSLQNIGYKAVRVQ